MLVPVVLFIVGLVLLIKGGDWFVDGAEGNAHRYHIPEILIWATVVSIGTTIPEVLVSSIAAGLGQSQTAYGNAIGSVICNTALIAAITIAVKPADTVDTGTFRIPVSSSFALRHSILRSPIRPVSLQEWSDRFFFLCSSCT